MSELPGMKFILGNFLEKDTQKKIEEMLGSHKLDVVLSDMVSN